MQPIVGSRSGGLCPMLYLTGYVSLETNGGLAKWVTPVSMTGTLETCKDRSFLTRTHNMFFFDYLALIFILHVYRCIDYISNICLYMNIYIYVWVWVCTYCFFGIHVHLSILG